jgi:Protein of unknown function (DUF3102)
VRGVRRAVREQARRRDLLFNKLSEKRSSATTASGGARSASGETGGFGTEKENAMTEADLAPLAGDNALPDLAARIRAEHEAVSHALKESVRHAITAGELLIEAKEQLDHGQWLPWLRDHCTISERTAQLYMRVAKNREEIENQMRNGVGDLSLNEAVALLMLSSDVRKVLDFAKQAEGTVHRVLHRQQCRGFPLAELQPVSRPQRSREAGMGRFHSVLVMRHVAPARRHGP